MSSDVDDDQVLPESLQKLEIVPVYSHSQSACKSNNEHNQNPFYSELSTANSIDDRITKGLFGPSCNNCGTNEKPCSVNSQSTTGKDVPNRSWRNRGSSLSQCIEHSINKQIHFKHRDREKSQILSEKKLTILREPILKSIGRSVYHNGTQNKLCCEPKPNRDQKMPKDDLVNATTRICFDGKPCEQCANTTDINRRSIKCDSELNHSHDASGSGTATTNNQCRQVPSASDANNVMIHRIQNWQLSDDSTVDFKSLVNECNNLTLTAHETAISSIVELHKTTNFQTLQSNQIDGAATSSNGGNETHSSNNSIHTAATSTAVAAGNNAMNCSLSSNSSNSSSCSQQARMNSSNCDVTIDELASYIEFQLHLPKPMSSSVYEAMFS